MSVSPSAGDIRWTGSDFEGYNIGTQWPSFTKDTQGGGGKVAAAKYQKFISSGVFSVPEGVTTVWVTMGGGGGGGGGGMVNYNAIVAPGGGGGQGQSVVLKRNFRAKRSNNSGNSRRWRRWRRFWFVYL